MVILSNKNEQITWKRLILLKSRRVTSALTLRSVRWSSLTDKQASEPERKKKIAYFLITLFKPTFFLVYNPLWEHIKKRRCLRSVWSRGELWNKQLIFRKETPEPSICRVFSAPHLMNISSMVSGIPCVYFDCCCDIFIHWLHPCVIWIIQKLVELSK